MSGPARRVRVASDEAELEELLDLARRVVRYELPMSAGAESDDLAQQAVIAYYQTAAVQDIANPRGWVRLTARRLAWKYRAKWRANRDNPPILAATPPPGANAVGRASESALAALRPDAIVTAELMMLLEAAIEELPGTQRDIARLAFLADPALNGPEIAAQLGLAPGTVRNNLTKIRAALRELLQEE